ncbi:nucleotidyltransferase family protein, partial [Magnetococcales bacterium HHB-1]
MIQNANALHDYGYWPDRMETALLQAILLKTEVTPELLKYLMQPHLNPGVAQILPSLSDHPQFNTFPSSFKNSIHQQRQKTKYAFYSLKMQLYAVHKILSANNIEFLIIKGMALAQLYYPHLTHRPMGDIDLVVQRNDIKRTLEILSYHGFIKQEEVTCNPKAVQALSMLSPEQIPIDIHSAVLHSSLWPDADQQFWQNKQAFKPINRVGIHVLSHTDHLLLTLLHGFRHNPISPIRWIVDAGYILRKNCIDWSYLQRQAIEHDCTSLLYAALHYLKTEMRQNIPDRLLNALQNNPSS